MCHPLFYFVDVDLIRHKIEILTVVEGYSVGFHSVFQWIHWFNAALLMLVRNYLSNIKNELNFFMILELIFVFRFFVHVVCLRH